MAPTRAQLLETSTAFVESFQTWTMEAIFAKRGPNMTHKILPESLGRPELDNAAFRKHMEHMMQVIPDGFKVDVNYKEPVIDEAARRVVVFAKCSAETPVGPYQNEYVFIFTLNEDGTLVEKLDEFLDSQLVRDLEARLAAVNVKV